MYSNKDEKLQALKSGVTSLAFEKCKLRNERDSLKGQLEETKDQLEKLLNAVGGVMRDYRTSKEWSRVCAVIAEITKEDDDEDGYD